MKKHWIDTHNAFKLATSKEKNTMVARARGWYLQSELYPYWMETVVSGENNKSSSVFTGFHQPDAHFYVPTGYSRAYEPISDRNLSGILLTEMGNENEVSLMRVKDVWRVMMVTDEYRTVYMYEANGWEEAVSGLFVIWKENAV